MEEKKCRNCKYLQYQEGDDGTGLDDSYICTRHDIQIEPEFIYKRTSCEEYEQEVRSV